MPRQLAVLCLVLLINLGEAHFLEPAASPPKPKKAAGANENSPVFRRDGLVLAPNSTADGSGCIAFWDRMPTGKLLSQAEAQQTIGDCCRTCRETALCNAFVWCPRKSGCHTGSSFSNIARLPYQGCALLFQGLSEASTGRPTLAIKAPGFAGGAPITVGDLPELPGYMLRLGRGYFNRYDYICEGSAAASSCMLWGRAHELAARCDADPLCRIMIDLPFGWDYLGGAMTSFKGGLDCGITAEGAELEGILNPNAATYMKLGPLPARPHVGSVSSADMTVTIMVGAVGVLATIAALGWSRQGRAAPAASAEYSQQQQQQQQQQQGQGLVSGKGRPYIHDSAREEVPEQVVAQARSVAASGPPSGNRTAAWVAAAAAGEQPVEAAPRMSRMHSSGPAGHPVGMWVGMGSLSLPSRVSSMGEEEEYPRSGDFGRASASGGMPSGSMGSAFAAPALQALRQPQPQQGSMPPAVNLAPATSVLPSPFGGFQAQSAFDDEQEDVDTPQSATTATGTATELQHSARSSGGGGNGSGQHSSSMRSPMPSGGGAVSGRAPPSSRPPPGPSRLPPMRVLPGGGSGGQVFSGGERSAGSAGGQLLSHRSGGSDTVGSSSAAKLLSRLPEQHWEDWVVDFETIEFCMNPDGSYVSLGSGGFGTVYKIMLDGVQPYAAKVLDLGQEDELQNVFLREASVLQRLRHRNIVGFRGVSVSEGRGIIIMELMEGADLFSRLTVCNKATGERQFSWYNRGKRVALDVARGIHYLHSLHLTHFDIKASNVLISRAGTAKLADVGFTRAMANTHHSIKDNRVGTFSYMAPELLMGTKCTNSVDIFSFGVLLWEICSGEHPVRGQLRGLRVPEEAPQDVVDLCEDCMAVEPAARPSARQVVERLLKVMAPPATAAASASPSELQQQSR